MKTYKEFRQELKEKDSRLEKAGVKGYNQHKRKLKNRMAGVKQADESTLGELSMTKSDLTKTGMRVDSKKMAELKKELMKLKKGLKVKMEEYKEFRQELKEKDSRLEKAGVKGYNQAKRTPGHPKKSHIVVAKDGDKVKTIRFGEQGASTAGDPKKGESDKMKKKRASFKARHAKNIAKGKMSAAYWADKEKW